MARYEIDYSAGSRGRYDNVSGVRQADARHCPEGLGNVRPAVVYDDPPAPEPPSAAQVRAAKVELQKRQAAAARKARS